MEREPQKALPLVSVKQQEYIDALMQRIEAQLQEASQEYVGRPPAAIGVVNVVEVELIIKGDDADE